MASPVSCPSNLPIAPRRAPASRPKLWGLLALALWLAVGCSPALPGATAEPRSSGGALVVAVEPEPTLAPTSTPVPAPADPAPTATSTPLPRRVAAINRATQQATSTPAATAATDGQSPAEATQFSGQRALQDVQQLADQIGSRVAGGSAIARASEYLESQLEAAGLPAEQRPFQFTAFQDRGSSLEIDGPEPASVDAETLAYSGAGDLQAEVVEVGLARNGDFSPDEVRGKIALAERGEIRFSDKAANLAAAGAVGVIISNNQSGNFAGSLGRQADVPVVAVSQEEGQQLRDRLAAGPVVAHLRVDAGSAEQTGRNVVSTRTGGPRTVVIGAHYDSVAAGPGANDNASGTATMLELARVIAKRTYPFSVEFVAFDAEEIGLIGSSRYVESLGETDRRAVLAMINLDMVGVGDRLSFGGDSVLVEPALRVAAELGQTSGRMRGGSGSSSDHANFQAVGIPALFVYRGEDPNYHTAGDQSGHVQAEHLEAAGRIVLAILDELAQQQP